MIYGENYRVRLSPENRADLEYLRREYGLEGAKILRLLMRQEVRRLQSRQSLNEVHPQSEEDRHEQRAAA